ncbi:hypothetical protein ACFS07_20535 [Undibacterium arcticum]
MSSIQPIPMKFRVPEIAFPKGWYCVAEADEISADTLKPVSYLNQQLIGVPHPVRRGAGGRCLLPASGRAPRIARWLHRERRDRLPIS